MAPLVTAIKSIISYDKGLQHLVPFTSRQIHKILLPFLCEIPCELDCYVCDIKIDFNN